jgi:hypothetical protein
MALKNPMNSYSLTNVFTTLLFVLKFDLIKWEEEVNARAFFGRTVITCIDVLLA